VVVRLVEMNDHGLLDYYFLDDSFHQLPDYRRHFSDDCFDSFLDRFVMESLAWNLPLVNYSRRIEPFQRVLSPPIQVLRFGNRFPSWVDDNVVQCDRVDHCKMKR
jgi:hypothetical protein